MDMRLRFWATVTFIKFKQIYYEKLKDYNFVIDSIISALCLVASAASIAMWDAWRQYPLVWGTIVATAQIVQVLRPLLSYQRRITALNYLIPELISLSNDVEHEWLHARGASDADLLALIKKYDDLAISVEAKFTCSIYFPTHKRIHEEAQLASENFFKYRYEKGGEFDARSEAPVSAET